MADETFYLELSEGSSHKFYEVRVEGEAMTVRFGRIGDEGQAKTTRFATHDRALEEARKKVGEKTRKGYERAVKGERTKRAVTRRTAVLESALASAPTSSRGRASAAARPSSNRAPMLWNFEAGSAAFGIFVDAASCWVGTESGKVFALDHEGQVQMKYRLPDGVKCIVSDGAWLYAGCDDGRVYDLSGKAPMVAYTVEADLDIFWLDISDAVLAVSDTKGGVTTFNHEDETQWSRKSSGIHGWMVRCDEIGVYHGHAAGVTMYDWEDGREIWHRPTEGAVLFGWQEESTVYAGTSRGAVYSFSKAGVPGPVYQCDGAIFSCAAAEDGKFVFAADSSGNLYCFAEDGERLWRLATGCGVALSMQYFREKVYVVTQRGSLACIDASAEAIEAAQRGSVPNVLTIRAPAVEETPVATVATTSDAAGGVMVECYRTGGALRVRVVSPGYDSGWHCQFPKEIREEGARYVVDEVRESARGGFYRALGTIRRLV